MGQSNVGESITFSLLGVLLGHPGITSKSAGYPKSGMELEHLDNEFDDVAYRLGWVPWGWQPGLCINCCEPFVDAGAGDCRHCGWLQGRFAERAS